MCKRRNRERYSASSWPDTFTNNSFTILPRQHDGGRNSMKLTATHNDPQVSGEAIAALTALGFSNIRIEVDGAAKASIQPLRNEEKYDTIVCPGGKQGVEA